jgi:hypothetical protein
MVPEKWSPQWGLELSHESSALTTRPRLLAERNKSLNIRQWSLT